MLSICFPVFNAESRIERALSAMDAAVARLGTSTNVEVLVVDNASTDRTREVVAKIWGRSAASYQRRIVSEPRQGAGYARLKAWTEATGAILVFCDDDVVPDPDSLQILVSLAQNDPMLGGGGGQIVGQLVEGAQWPAWFDQTLKSNLALTGDFLQPLCNPPDRYFPVSAFVWFRREALRSWADHLQNSNRFVLGPSGKAMWRADDQEMDMLAVKSGWTLKFHPTIRAAHQIPPGRLTVDYMVRLMYWNGRSWMRLRNRWDGAGWFYCASRVAYYLAYRRIRESIIIISGWGKCPEQRFKPGNPSEPANVNRMMHFAFRAGVYDEMVAKAINPVRF